MRKEKDNDAYQKLKLLTDSIPGGLATFEVTPGGVRMLYLSDGVYGITGFTPEDNDGTDNPLRYVYRSDLPMIKTKLLELMNGGKSLELSYRVIHKSGGYRWLTLLGSQIERTGNKVIINTVMLDVTEQKKAELKLNRLEKENRLRYENEIRLRHELVSNSIFYYQLNITTGIVEEYFFRYLKGDGVRKFEKTGEERRKMLLENVHPDDKEIVRDTIFSKALLESYRKGIKNLSLQYRRKVNSEEFIWVETRCTIMEKPDSGEVIAFLHCHDIDLRKREQIAIETVMDDEIESVTVLHVKTGLAHIAHNRGEKEDAENHHLFCFEEKYRSIGQKLVLAEERDLFVDFFKVHELCEQLKHTKKCSITYQMREFGKICRKLSRAYYLDESKEEIVLVRQDITTLYEEEQEQRRVLEAAMKKANEANRAKSEFLSQMSHDIRTPLNAVLAFSNEEMLIGAGEKRLRENLRKINLSGDYLLGIINDVLDMSKIEQNKIVLMPTIYTFDEFTTTISNFIDELSKKRKIEFSLDYFEEDISPIWIDKVRFNQIFINLLSNAVKFTKKGGKVELLIRKLSEEAGVVRQQFIVRDNGIGMSEDFLPHAFEGFSQEYRRETSEKNQGTGLGLAIVKELVTMMNGTIEVESTIGKGSSFTLEFPLRTVTEEELEKCRKKEHTNEFCDLNGMRILICEDNEINTEIVTTLLANKGCILDCAKNGQEAVEKMLDSKVGYYQIILMDIRMPVMNGLEATIKIRDMNREDAKEIPIIAMTADAFDEDIRNVYQAGMNSRISKPFVPKELYQICYEYGNK